MVLLLGISLVSYNDPGFFIELYFFNLFGLVMHYFSESIFYGLLIIFVLTTFEVLWLLIIFMFYRECIKKVFKKTQKQSIQEN